MVAPLHCCIQTCNAWTALQTSECCTGTVLLLSIMPAATAMAMKRLCLNKRTPLNWNHFLSAIYLLRTMETFVNLRLTNHADLNACTAVAVVGHWLWCKSWIVVHEKFQILFNLQFTNMIFYFLFHAHSNIILLFLFIIPFNFISYDPAKAHFTSIYLSNLLTCLFFLLFICIFLLFWP
jgi:hypothetical protein